MATQSKTVDLREHPELLHLVELIRESGEECVLRDGDENIAVIRPILAGDESPVPNLTEEGIERLWELAGAWSGIVDTERLRLDHYESRRILGRPRVQL